jgi:hypothetical protein
MHETARPVVENGRIVNYRAGPIRFAAGPAGVLVFGERYRRGQPIRQPRCCLVRFVANDGRVVWRREIFLRHRWPSVVAAGNRFVVVPNRARGSRRPRVIVVSGHEGVVDEWMIEFPIARKSGMWGFPGGILVTDWLENSDTARVTELSTDGERRWRLRLPGRVLQAVRGRAGTYILTDGNRDAHGIWMWSIHRGRVLWSRLVAPNPWHVTEDLLLDRRAVYLVEFRFDDRGPQTWIRRIDPTDGTVVAKWQVATARLAPTIMVAGRAAYLAGDADDDVIPVQRIEWPPGKQGE